MRSFRQLLLQLVQEAAAKAKGVQPPLRLLQEQEAAAEAKDVKADCDFDKDSGKQKQTARSVPQVA